MSLERGHPGRPELRNRGGQDGRAPTTAHTASQARWRPAPERRSPRLPGYRVAATPHPGGPMPAPEIAFMPAVEVAARIRSRELSPVEVLDAALGQYEALDP